MLIPARIAPLLVLAVFTWLAPARADAAARVAPAGKLRVHLDTEAFGWTQSRRYYEPGELRDPFNPRTNVLGFGLGRPVTGDAVSASGGGVTVSYSMIGLGIGYGIHRNLILGARFGFNASRLKDRTDDPMDPNDDASTVFVGGFVPYLEILPIAEGTVLPYILLRTGFVGSTLALRDPDDFSRFSTMAPTVGVGGGAHAFLTPYFSLDFGLTFDYRWVHGRSRVDAGGPIVVQPEWVRVNQSFTLAATLGISTWF